MRLEVSPSVAARLAGSDVATRLNGRLDQLDEAIERAWAHVDVGLRPIGWRAMDPPKQEPEPFRKRGIEEHAAQMRAKNAKRREKDPHPHVPIPNERVRATIERCARLFRISTDDLMNYQGRQATLARRYLFHELKVDDFTGAAIARYTGFNHATVYWHLRMERPIPPREAHNPVKIEGQLGEAPCPDLSGEWAI